jgi:hypothetical protein
LPCCVVCRPLEMHRFEVGNKDQLKTGQPINGTLLSLGLKKDNLNYHVGATEAALLTNLAKGEPSNYF